MPASGGEGRRKSVKKRLCAFLAALFLLLFLPAAGAETADGTAAGTALSTADGEAAGNMREETTEETAEETEAPAEETEETAGETEETAAPTEDRAGEAAGGTANEASNEAAEAADEEAPPQPVFRALLVTCDRFVSRMETSPAGQRNAVLMREILEGDGRGYALIRTECDTIASVEAFSAAVRETFGDAGENDVSVLYVSTHGLYTANRSNLSASLLLSDGENEEQLTARALADILSPVPGRKVVLLDACHSGAFIGKGLSDLTGSNPFSSEAFEVLCSAGGSEESWYWRADGGETLNGAGYFTSILARGLGAGLPADRDGDGQVTMRELRRYLLDHYAASTPWLYPEDSGCVFYRAAEQAGPEGPVGEVVFDSAVFSGSVVQLGFSFTLNSPCAVFYQLVYDRQGAWDFASAPMISDGEEGTLLPAGTYDRYIALRLGDEDQTVSGYLMLQLYTRRDGQTALNESRLLRVFPSQGDIALSVETGPSFIPALGGELAVRVSHDIPCALTVTVQNAAGRTVRVLSMEEPTRPQRLVPEGSCLYWDGKMSDGTQAPPGRYLVRVQTVVAGRVYYAYSGYCTLLDEKISGRLFQPIPPRLSQR